jgi:hypothetical protein
MNKEYEWNPAVVTNAQELPKGEWLPLDGSRRSWVAATKINKGPGQPGKYRIDLVHCSKGDIDAGKAILIEKNMQEKEIKFYLSHKKALLAGRKEILEKNKVFDKEIRKSANMNEELQKLLDTSDPEDL